MGKDKQGYTLVELIVVMAIFSVVAMAISVTFSNLLKQEAQQSRSATSQIAGIVGLEMLRSDIAHAGFALPWSYQVTPTFTEVTLQPVAGLVDATKFAGFNETTPPHAVLGTASSLGPHYLVLKSALLALNSPSIGHWGFVNYSSGSQSTISTNNDPATDVLSGQDRLISLNVSFDTLGNETRQLLMADATTFYYPVTYTPPAKPVPPAWAQPSDPTQSAIAYAISDTNLRMPYNRADYYVDFNASKPRSCSQGTGVLYKAVAGQLGTYRDASGSLLAYPLLNCVGDMQVVFGLDTTGSGSVNSYNAPDSTTVTGLSAAELRAQLRQVMVYILAHEGGKDTNYSYPGLPVKVGYGVVSTWDQSRMIATFGADWMHYRWKVYSIVVNMPNMQQ